MIFSLLILASVTKPVNIYQYSSRFSTVNFSTQVGAEVRKSTHTDFFQPKTTHCEKNSNKWHENYWDNSLDSAKNEFSPT